jgi:hypothetical protein
VSNLADWTMTFGPFSYLLQLHVYPDWDEIVRRVVGFTNREDQEAFVARLILQSDRMLHRYYDFIEFFDSGSGPKMRLQEKHLDGRTDTTCVTKFSDRGYLFGDDSPAMPHHEWSKYLIYISESTITANGDDKPFCSFPILDAIVEFGIALQLRFPDLSVGMMKLPEQIEAVLVEENIKCMNYVSKYVFLPGQEGFKHDIASEDPEFFVRYGRPQVVNPFGFHNASSFKTACCSYDVELKVFTPKTAKSDSRFDSSLFQF